MTVSAATSVPPASFVPVVHRSSLRAWVAWGAMSWLILGAGGAALSGHGRLGWAFGLLACIAGADIPLVRIIGACRRAR